MTHYDFDTLWSAEFRRLMVQLVIAAAIVAVLAIGWMAVN